MKISKFKHLMSFYGIILASDGIGGQRESWINISSTWTFLTPVKYDTPFRNSNSESTKYFTLTTKYESQLFETKMAELGNRRFIIQRVVNRNEENKFLDMYAIEVKNEYT